MGGRPLGERTRAALRPAFAREVGRHVPGMQAAAADVLLTGAVAPARRLRHHAHTLAAGAALLGEQHASLAARNLERTLSGWCEGVERVPREVAAAAAAEVEAIALMLAGWVVHRGTA